MGIKTELAKLIGAEKVFDDAKTLALYSKDKSFAKPMTPECVVKVTSGDDVEKLVKWANETKTPLVPVSSGAPHFRGDTVPGVPQAVIVDLSGMKKILNINVQQRMAVIEPGVTYSELNKALAKQGLMISTSLAPKATKSVVASVLECEPRLNSNHQWAYTEPLRCTEVTWGDGNRMYTGEAAMAPMDLEAQWKEQKFQVEQVGPMMLDYFRLLTQAEGTMGIVSWASVRCELAYQAHKMFLVPAAKEEELLDFVNRVSHFRFGEELFILNNAQLASLVGETAEEIAALKAELPQWVACVSVGGRDLLPQDRAEQQEADIAEIAQQFGLTLQNAVTGVSAVKVLNKAINPCGKTYWKDTLKGSFQDIFFLTTLDKTAEFVAKMEKLAKEAGYPVNDIGVYVQPVHMGSAYHCEFTIPYNPESAKETEKVKALFDKASAEFSAMGAFYARPYGPWARLQLNKDAMGTQTLKTLKGIFDPNNIMNPGKVTI